MTHYAEWIIRHRLLVIAATVIVTGVLIAQTSKLSIIMDTTTMLPQAHPYIVATNTVERVFGSKFLVVIGITPKQGDAFQPLVLEKVQRLTAAFLHTPGVVKANLLSLAAPKAKNIQGTADGIEVRPLMATPPTTPAQVAALKAALQANPVYLDALVATAGHTAALIVEFADPHEAGHRSVLQAVQTVVDKEREPAVEITIAGAPILLGNMELYSERMIVLVPLAILLIGLIHFEAFRTLQGLVLPLMTALLAVVWGLGIIGLSGIPMDAFNAMTPILILAVAAGHAVQILKRYYEEYHHLRHTTALSPHDANRLAVVQSITAVGPVMLTAGLIAALGFLSLTVFEIRGIKTFGLFTGVGILSALALEMTFIPALRSWLRAPGEREAQREQAHTVWDRITGAIAALVTGPQRVLLVAGTAALLVVGLLGMSRIVIDNNDRAYFASWIPFIQDDEALNTRLGGTNTLYMLIEGQSEDTIKDPAVLKALDATQTFISQQPHVGKTISLADFVKRLNQAMNGDDPAAYRIPDTQELIAQYLLLYSMSGEPGDFDAYVDYGYTSAVITAFLKTDSSLYAEELMAKVSAYARSQFPPQIRFSFGGSVAVPTALNEVLVRDKILNIIQIGSVVGVISSLVFRSLLAGILVLLPLLVANSMLVSVFAALTLIPFCVLLFRPRFLFAPDTVRVSPAVAALLAVGLGIGLYFAPLPAHAQDLTATEVMEKNFVATKVLGSTSDATFTLINKTGQQRVRKTLGTTKLQANGRDNMRMVRFLLPPDVKGTVTLLIEHADKDDDIWIYLPALKKVRRLVSSNKKDSFVGTDFSYGDVIGHKVEEWEHKLLREEAVEGQPCYVIESTPKSDTVRDSSGYAKRVNWIRKDNFVTLKGESWDQAGQPFKTFTVGDVQLVDSERGRWQPMRLEAVNVQTEHRTILQFENFKLKPDIEDEFFTTRYMEQEP